MHRFRALLAAIAVLSVLAAACGGDDTSDADGDTSPTTAGSDGTGAPGGDGDGCTEERVGGEVTMGVYSEAKGLDPTITGGTGRTGDTELAAVYDTLMRYDPETGEFQPWVAESLTSDDNVVWTLELRPDVLYGNGDTLSAQDVADNIERTKVGANATTKSLAAQVASMEVIDPLTLEITLESPYGSFPGVLAGGAGMVVNPRVVESMTPEDLNLMPTGAGVGPYEPTRFSPGEEIVLTARDDYWGGPVCIEQLRFVYITGARGTYEALTTDEVQVAFLREPVVVAEAKEAGYDGFSQIQNAGEALVMNSGVEGTDPATADPRVRQAVVLALDLDLIDERANEGTGLPTPDLMYPESRLSPGVDGLTNQPDEARRLVEEAKADGWDGSIQFLCDTAPYRQEEALAVEAMLNDVGFEVELENNVNISDLVTRVLVEGNFELSCWGLNVNDENPWVGLDQFRSDSPSNYMGYANEEVDAAVAELKATGDEEGARDALGQIQEAWNADPPVAVVGAFENFITWDDRVEGIVPSASTMILFSEAYLAD